MAKRTSGLWAGISCGMAMGLLLMMPSGGSAQGACVCSNNAEVIPNPTAINIGVSTTSQICVTNRSTDNPPTQDVDAVLRSGAFFNVRLACEDGVLCTLPLPGVLVFDSCSAIGPGVGNVTCGLDLAADPEGNTVRIDITNDIALPPDVQVCFASVTSTGGDPVITNLAGEFDQALQGVNTVLIQDPSCSPGIDCDATSSGNLFFPPVCDVEVDKQVSCDGGVTWLDMGLVEENEDGTNDPCEGWNAFDGNEAEDILVQYQARNPEDANLELSCTFDESNPGIPAVAFPTLIAIGETTDFVMTQAACSPELVEGGAEPDTATLDCTCPATTGEGGLNLTATASDEANFMCLQPTLNVSKVCDDDDGDGTDDTVRITVANAGTADLANCVVTDTLDLDEGQSDPACNTGTELLGDGFTPGPTQDVLVDDIASLPAMTMMQTVTGTIDPPLEQNACNLGSVICDVVGADDKTITAEAEDTCIVKRICDVQVDKQIDAGIGFVDVSDFCDESLDPDPGEGLCAGGPDAGDPCDPTDPADCRTIAQAIGWTGEPVDFKFLVQNTGEASVRCTVTDDKVEGPIITEVIVPPGGMEMVTVNETCRAELTPSDTATLSCECLDDQDVATDETVSDTDTVALACQTPGLAIAKECAEQVGDTNVVTICPGLDPNECRNTGTATLINCSVTDDLCNQTFAVGTLAPGATYGPFDCNVVGLTQPTDNTATITCEISDDGTPTGNPVIDPCIAGTCMVGGGSCEVDADCGPKKVTAMDLDLCEVEADECLTRTPGFWCTHPHITELFLPLESCGIDLTTVMSATPGSATEDLVFGNDPKQVGTSPQQLQLIRQCTAAALNFAASEESDGSCEGVLLSNQETISEVFDSCCGEDLCDAGASGSTISNSGCIELLDEFNNSEDTFEEPPAPFDRPGPAQPGFCQDATGNGFVNPDRNLGPGQGGPKGPKGRP